MNEIAPHPETALALETQFLSGLEKAQNAYELIVETRAWVALGFDSFGSWWDERVRPAMTALSMRPTREIAASVVELVRAEEAELPPAQRRTQVELAAMAGISTKTLQRQSQDRAQETLSAGTDLDERPTTVVTEQRLAESEDIDDVPLWDEPISAAMPARQEIADLIASRLDLVVEAQAKPAAPATPVEARERDYQASSEAWSRNLAKCVYLLAGFSNLNGFVEKALKE